MKLIQYLYKKVSPCNPCEFGCCKATYCHKHGSWDCSKKFWYRLLIVYLTLDDWFWDVKWFFSKKWK